MNRKLANIFLMALSLAGAHAEPGTAPVSPPAKEAASPVSGASAAKVRLIDAVNADLKAIKNDQEDTRAAAALTSLIADLKRATPAQIGDPGGIDRHLEYNLVQGQASEKTRDLYQEFIRLTREELAAEQKKVMAETHRIGQELLQKAISTPAGDTAMDLESRFDALSGELRRAGQTGGRDTGSGLSQLDTVLGQIRSFHQARIDGDLSRMANGLDSMLQSLRRMPQFMTGEEAYTNVESLRKQGGLPTPAELGQMPKQLLGELLDDANQDRLDEIRSKMERYRMLAGSSSGYYRNTAGISNWSALSSMSTALAQAVQQVRNGEAPRLSPDRMLREDESGGKPLITRAELMKRVGAYQVRVPDGNGGTTTAPLYYDAREIMERIKTLADLRKELPVLKRSMLGGGGYSQDGIDWSSAIIMLESLAVNQGKLEAGGAFVWTTEAGMGFADGRRQSMLAQGHALAPKLNALYEELVLAVLRRFHPSIPAGGKAAPEKLLASLFEQARAGRKYRDILTLQQLAQQFTPGVPLVSSHEVAAIGHYLAGLRQDDELSEPRLATCYLQKAAAIRSDIIPLEELKGRLQRLKQEHPEDYQKGIDDMLKGVDLEGRYSQVPWSLGQLTVPAASQ